MTLVATWPKSRSLDSYVDELRSARDLDLLINFRINRPPKQDVRGGYLYMVHDGAVRGCNLILDVAEYGEREVSRVKSEAFAGFWPAGWYIVRSPEWFALDKPIPMRGFQGWRYWEMP